jgi:hypothetical protein
MQSLKKLINAPIIKKFLAFLESAGTRDYSKEPVMGPILCKINSVHIFQSYIFKIDFNIILPSTFSQPSPSFRFSSQNFVKKPEGKRQLGRPIRKTMKQDSQSSGKDSNMGPPEYRDGDYTETFHAV